MVFYFLACFIPPVSILARVKNTQCIHTMHKLAFVTLKSLVLLLRPSIRLYRPEPGRLMPDT